MNKIITIFILPNEIDLYKDLIKRIIKDIESYDLEDFWIDSTLCVCDEMVNWEKSKVSKKEIIEVFNNTNKGVKGDFSIDYEGKLKGCVDKRRESSPEKYPNATSFTWIDPDILFPDGTFYIINESVEILKDSNFVLTPQYPKMWDDSWDVLVHGKYMNFPYNYMNFSAYNPEDLFGIFGDVYLKQLDKGTFKFGGGAITTFSSSILKFFPIPNSFGPYGEEDTFIMTLCSSLFKKFKISQYLISNLVFSQKDRKNLDRRYDISVFNKKVEYRKISLDNFNKEVLKYLN